MLLFFYGLWFGYTLYRGGQQGKAGLASADNDNNQYASL
jgi:hypothetical protein